VKADTSLVVYIDVDDTLVRSAGTKTMPIPSVIEHVKQLANSGAELYCWSSVGAEYARTTARNLGIESCFVAFLPKPHIVIDDQAVTDWKHFATVHSLNVAKSVDEYKALVEDPPRTSR
jgi:predicted HAD superfamily phosphohydrolase YqeG